MKHIADDRKKGWSEDEVRQHLVDLDTMHISTTVSPTASDEAKNFKDSKSNTTTMSNGYTGGTDNHNNDVPEHETLEYYEARHPLRPLSALQKHVLFWDRDCDGIIWPYHIYLGFRELGFSIIFSIGALLIPFWFSYPTRLGHSWLPDPFFRIYMASGNKSKHGSDTGLYTLDGHFNEQRFDEMFATFDRDGAGGLSVEDTMHIWQKNRVAHDFAGWCFAFMEWWTTWLLLQQNGRIWKDDLRACYDGTLFWKISNARKSPQGWQQGYGIEDFLYGIIDKGTWRSWVEPKFS